MTERSRDRGDTKVDSSVAVYRYWIATSYEGNVEDSVREEKKRRSGYHRQIQERERGREDEDEDEDDSTRRSSSLSLFVSASGELKILQ